MKLTKNLGFLSTSFSSKSFHLLTSLISSSACWNPAEVSKAFPSEPAKLRMLRKPFTHTQEIPLTSVECKRLNFLPCALCKPSPFCSKEMLLEPCYRDAAAIGTAARHGPSRWKSLQTRTPLTWQSLPAGGNTFLGRCHSEICGISKDQSSGTLFRCFKANGN